MSENNPETTDESPDVDAVAVNGNVSEIPEGARVRVHYKSKRSGNWKHRDGEVQNVGETGFHTTATVDQDNNEMELRIDAASVTSRKGIGARESNLASSWMVEVLESEGEDTETDGGVVLDVSEDITLKPHPNELESAVNGDHTVQFSFTDADPMFRLELTGEPLDLVWNSTWTDVEIPAEDVPAIAVSEETHTVKKNGARFQVTGEVVQR